MKKKLECINCRRNVDINELLHVDLSVKNMDPEKAEFIWDQLPEVPLDDRKIEKYLHMSNLGYKVLNVCLEYYQKALKKYGDCA